ncbi:hypothetical protein Tco_1427789, partial [Tanacetum coccineum]
MNIRPPEHHRRHHLRSPEKFSGDFSDQHQICSSLPDLPNPPCHSLPRATTTPTSPPQPATTTPTIIILSPSSSSQPPPEEGAFGFVYRNEGAFGFVISTEE